MLKVQSIIGGQPAEREVSESSSKVQAGAAKLANEEVVF
jgi:hypothetical protein